MISKDFLEMLRCPLDPSRSKLVAVGEDLVCERCALCFSIHDGNPNMIVEQATLPKGVESVAQLPCQQQEKRMKAEG